MRDELRRLALIGAGVAELTRNRAEKIVKDLTRSVEIGPSDTRSLVQDLIERSRQNRIELSRVVRAELRGQIEKLGVAGKRDLERLERRVARLEERAKATPAARAGGATKRTSSKKTAVRQPKATARKASPSSGTGASARTTGAGGRDRGTPGSAGPT